MPQPRGAAPRTPRSGAASAATPASNVLPLPTASVLYEALFHATELPQVVAPGAGTGLLGNRALFDVSGYTAADLSRLSIADLIEPSGSALRCRDGTALEIAIHEAEIVAAGHVVGTLYELRPPPHEAAATLVQSDLRPGLETAGVVHDLNNLLTVLSGHAELLAAELPATNNAVSRIAPLRQAADEAAMLARRLLEVARGHQSERVPIDPGEVAASAVALAAAAPGATCAVTLETEPGLPAIAGDRLQLEHVLLNLVRNAQDAVATRYAGHDAAPPPIEVTVAADRGGEVVCTVRDSGVGMPPEVQARMFEPHFTTKALGSGSGLGLATASALVTAHGGRIEVDSTEGAGTTFTVVLPAAAEQPAG